MVHANRCHIIKVVAVNRNYRCDTKLRENGLVPAKKRRKRLFERTDPQKKRLGRFVQCGRGLSNNIIRFLSL
jgi:hypothetical protein